MNEKNAAVEASSMHRMQKDAREETSPVLDFMTPQSPVHLVSGDGRGTLVLIFCQYSVMIINFYDEFFCCFVV